MSRTDLKEHYSTIFCQRLQILLACFFFFIYFNQTPVLHAWEICPFTLNMLVSFFLLPSSTGCPSPKHTYQMQVTSDRKVRPSLWRRRKDERLEGRESESAFSPSLLDFPEGVRQRGRRRGRGGTTDIINGDASRCVHLPCEKNDWLDCMRFPSCSFKRKLYVDAELRALGQAIWITR